MRLPFIHEAKIGPNEPTPPVSPWFQSEDQDITPLGWTETGKPYEQAQIPTEYELLDDLGTGATVHAYLVHDSRTNEKMVAKIELLSALDPTDPTSWISPIVGHGIGEERSNLTDPVKQAPERYYVSLQNWKTLLEYGIPAVQPIRSEIWKSTNNIPLYVEIWAYPGPGKMINPHDLNDIELYENGRTEPGLDEIAESLRQMTEVGIVSDFAHPNASDLKLPENFYLTEQGELAMIDYGLVVDLGSTPPWQKTKGGNRIITIMPNNNWKLNQSFLNKITEAINRWPNANRHNYFDQFLLGQAQLACNMHNEFLQANRR